MRALWLVVMLAACGGGSGAPDAAVDSSPFGEPSDLYPAFSLQAPEILNGGGPILTNVRVVPIYYMGDTNAPMLDDFYTKLAASTVWQQMVSEYGVTGGLTIAPAVTLGTTAPPQLSDADFQTLLAGQLDGTHSEYGAVDADALTHNVYMLHLPDSTMGTAPDGGSCVNFVGYHSDVAIAAGNAVYSLVYDCPHPAFLPDGFAQTTAATLHELVEAATDPIPEQRAWGTINVIFYPWILDFGTELADMCMHVTSSWYVPDELGYTIERSWSNAATANTHNPCVPVPPTATEYFVTTPVQTELIPFVTANQSTMIPGVTIARDQSMAVQLDFSSSGPTAPWTVQAVDDYNLMTGGAAILTFEFDRNTGQNGNHVHLTITPHSRPSNGIALYRLVSFLGTDKTLWWGAVYIP